MALVKAKEEEEEEEVQVEEGVAVRTCREGVLEGVRTGMGG